MKDFQQRGSVLVITLVLLLVVTALTVSSARDSALETQVMARNLQQQRLFNAAEAGLRDAERHIGVAISPLSACGVAPCLQGLATNHAVDFALATPYEGSFGPAATAPTVRWYIRLIPSASKQANDASYGEAAKAVGIRYYEVSSQAFFAHLEPASLNANCTVAVVCLRSVVARTYLEPQP